MRTSRSVFLAAALLLTPTASGAQTISADLAEFRGLYKELVEINTTLSAGDCTRAAQALATRLRAGGIPAEDIRIIVPPGMPKQGNLVARLRGTDPNAKAVLLVGHLDVVEANPADWERDPFKLIEENGVFYARGAADDKAMVSVLADSLIRYKKEGFRPRRDLKFIATCGEETSANFNGVKYLVENHRDLIDAEFGINENGNGRFDRQGRRVMLSVQAGQKVAQNFKLEMVSEGGRASRPQDGNIIYDMASALAKLNAYEFPHEFDAPVRAYFSAAAAAEGGALAADLRAVLQTPPEPAALARISADRQYGPIIRTTCTTTLIEGGHAANALPQRVTANVNCRIKPGTPVPEVQQTLERVLENLEITVTPVGEIAKGTAPPPLTRAIMEPIERLAAKLWPGTPVVPALVPGADDSRFLTPAGIPTYGISGQFRAADGDGTHALNERIPAKVLYESRDFLYELIKIYANS
jgi:acetylornithine deacetylase/succinyl-diaminopimelate desuccinylase-like protein